MKLHLFAHNNRNLVKVGDKVEQYKTPIGTFGTAGGAYYAHLHFSISKDLTPSQIKGYVNGWTKDQVKQSYIEPKDINFNKMMPNMPINVGVNGYDWLDNYGKGYHPGVDVNGDGGGNTDFDWEFRASCNGKVIA